MPSNVDLRDLVTVFVIYSGEPDYEACLKALEAQNCRFRIQSVQWVAPMDAAFQQMLDQCKTPYFVQVDADMVLRPHAVLTLYNDLARCDSKIAMVYYPLHDPHLGQLVLGVKVYRHAVMSRYPYTSSYSCEVSQVDAMKKDGYIHETRWPVEEAEFTKGYQMFDSPLVLGEHSPTWTEERIFDRYRRLAQKHRRFGYYWIEPLMQRFIERYREGGNLLDLWAYNGLLVGFTSPLDDDKEADFRETPASYQRLEVLLCDVGGGSR